MADVLAHDDVLSFSPSSPFLTAPDAGGPPSAPARTDLTPQIAEERQRAQATFDIAERSMAQEERDFAAREKELGPLRDRQLKMAMSGLDRAETAQRDLAAKTQKPPEPPKRQNPHDDETWLFAAGLLGVFAGALTRNHATNALNAFSGAIQGYQEGSKQKFDQNMQIWEAENKKVLDTNRQALDEYRAIIENTKLSQDQMSIALQVAASKYEDRGMMTAAKTKNSLVIAQYHDKNAQAMEQMQQSSDRLLQQKELADQRAQTQLAVAQMRVLGVQPGQASDVVKGIANYELPPVTGRGGSAIMNMVKQENPDYDVKVWYDKAIRSKIPAQSAMAGSTAASRTFNTAGANVEIVLSRAGPVLTNAAEAANAVPASEFKRINQLYQTAAEEISDPAVRNFKVANEELAGLFAAVNNPRSAQITVSAFQHARDLISAADGPDAYQKVLENIQRLAEREAKNIRALRAGGEPEPINIPPISPERRASVPELVEKTKERASKGVEGGFPNAGARTEFSGVRIGAKPGDTLESIQKKIRDIFGPGWGVKELP